MRDYRSILNDAQYEAATNKDHRLLMLAGAGTGKTHTLIHKTAYLVDTFMPTENILLVTFTNKAAHEMVERLEKMDIKGVTACTIHSFCAAELRKYSHLIDLDKSFSILNQSDTEEVVNMFREKDASLSAKQIAAIDSYAENKCISVREATILLLGPDFERFAKEAEEIIQEAKEYRLAHSMLSYDDLQSQMIRLLENPEVKQQLRKKYRYIMVDEYQDTNAVQDKILDMLDPEYLAVVGDDCQSLYAFRGAEVENILHFAEKHNCKTIKFEQNYRSNQKILDLTNKMMSDYNVKGISKTLTAVQNYGDGPSVKRPYTSFEEASLVLEHIKKWLENGNPPSELCVLVRTGRTSYYLETLLNAANIPFTKRGGPKFFETETIKDVMSLFDLTRNKKNRISWFRALMLIRNIGRKNSLVISEHLAVDRDVSKFSKRIYYNDLTELVEAVDDHSEWHEKLAHICDYYVKLYKRNLENSKSQKKDELELALETSVTAHLEMLQKIAAEYENEEDFVDGVMTDNVSQEEEDNIIISTIHSAKGLEFEFVIVMGVAEKSFPREYNDEELRCMYVALTRPKSYLLITSPKSLITNYGKLKVKLPCWIDYPEITGMESEEIYF